VIAHPAPPPPLRAAAAPGLIIGGAILFTNAIEWSGKRLDLGEGAVGSLLAAVGTALPESLIPVVGVLSGGESEQVAIGAIVGAPFMLGTLAMLVVGASALAFRRRRGSGSEVTADDRSLRRDLGFFLPCFAIGIGLGLIDSTSVHIAGAVGLLIAYGAYALMRGGRSGTAARARTWTSSSRSRSTPARRTRLATSRSSPSSLSGC
jgi:cation:H+ antiporter